MLKKRVSGPLEYPKNEIGLTVRLEDHSCLDFYTSHPAHQEILSLLKEIGMEDLLVVDFEM